LQIRQNIREFSIQDEHCSVLMEHRSVMGEQTTADWGYSVSGSQKETFSSTSNVFFFSRVL